MAWGMTDEQEEMVARRKKWLLSIGVHRRAIILSKLDNPLLSEDAFKALAREVIRYRSNNKNVHTRRKYTRGTRTD